MAIFRWLLIATLVLPMGCIIDGTVLMRPDGRADGGAPPDAGPHPTPVCVDDAGSPDAGPPDAGPPDAGPPPDAGADDAGCFSDPCASCRGCCESGSCHPGTRTLKCGSAGRSCEECAAGAQCVAGACTTAASGIDLTIEDLVITDLIFVPDAGFSFDVSATLRNLGQTPASGVRWLAALSFDTHVSLLVDEIAVESVAGIPVAASSGVRVRLRASPPAGFSRFRGSPPDGGALYVWGLVDSSATVPETNEANNTTVMELPYTPAACTSGTCSGCCTAGGCVPRAANHANACGVGGVSCSVCSFPQVCDAGTCQ